MMIIPHVFDFTIAFYLRSLNLQLNGLLQIDETTSVFFWLWPLVLK